MNYAVTKHLPCSVCGQVTLRHGGWFLVVENRWFDRIKILTWHSSLAAKAGVKSACCREHLKALVTHWLDHARLDLLPDAQNHAFPITSDAARPEIDLGLASAGCLVGELFVHRETFSRIWTGSAASLECILEALIPAPDETVREQLTFPLFHPSPARAQEVPIH
jgi:hypothetical protein